MSLPPSSRARTARPRRRAVAGLAAAVATLALLASACTPSGYAAEKQATSIIHGILTGQPPGGPTTCTEFENPSSGVFTGFCTSQGRTYAVRSVYGADRGTITVGRWDGPTGQCATLKAPDGTWGVWTSSCGRI